MNEIRLLRSALGLSQHQLADMLGTSRSLLSLAELGQRTLSPSALLHMTELVRTMRASPPESIDIEQLDPGIAERLTLRQSAEDAEVNERRSEALVQREKFQKQLDQRRARFSQASLAIQQLREEMSVMENLVSVTHSLNGRLSRATLQWEQNHPAHCRPLERRIAELDALITVWNTPVL